MARIKGAMMTRKRRKKVLKLAKGYYGSKHSLFKTAKQAVPKWIKFATVISPSARVASPAVQSVASK